MTERKRKLAEKRAIEVEERIVNWYAQPSYRGDPPDGSFAMQMWFLGYESALRESKRKPRDEPEEGGKDA